VRWQSGDDPAEPAGDHDAGCIVVDPAEGTYTTYLYRSSPSSSLTLTTHTGDDSAEPAGDHDAGARRLPRGIPKHAFSTQIRFKMIANLQMDRAGQGFSEVDLLVTNLGGQVLWVRICPTPLPPRTL